MSRRGHPTRWVRRDDVAVATFPDGVLAFQASDCRLLALNEMGAWLLAAVERPLGTEELARRLPAEAMPAAGWLAEDALRVLSEFEELRLIKRRLDPACSWEGIVNMTHETRFLANPDVSCRVEDENGAILYNPDTSSCQVINAVGLELWQALSEPRRLKDLTELLCSRYEAVTAECASTDVREFLKRLSGSGFVGLVDDGASDDL